MKNAFVWALAGLRQPVPTPACFTLPISTYRQNAFTENQGRRYKNLSAVVSDVEWGMWVSQCEVWEGRYNRANINPRPVGVGGGEGYSDDATFFSTLSKNFSPRSYQVRSPGQFKWQYLRNIYDWSVTTVLKGLLWIFSWVDKGISTHKKYIGIFITVTWGQVNMTHGGLTWPVPIKQWENVQKHFFRNYVM